MLSNRSKRQLLPFALIVVMLGAMLVSPPTVRATVNTYSVSNTSDDLNPGSLRYAITQANANAGSTINFGVGTGAQRIVLTSRLPTIAVSMTINATTQPGYTSANGPLVTIDGNNHQYQPFNVTGNPVAMLGLAIENGTSSGSDCNGGGALCNAGTLVITQGVIRNNVGNGGGILTGGTLTLLDTTVTGNTSLLFGGGGIYSVSASTLRLVNSTISGNSSGNSGTGGGITTSGTATITNSTISGNSAYNAAGIYNNGALTLTNSTVTSNISTSNFGGGVVNYGNLSVTATVQNTLVAGNTGNVNGDWWNWDTSQSHTTFTDGGYNLIGNTVTAFTAPGDQVGVTNPMVGPLTNNGGPTQTHALLIGSPAIDKIPTSGANCPSTDQRGISRPQGATCDIGAFEFAPPLMKFSIDDFPSVTTAGAVHLMTVAARDATGAIMTGYRGTIHFTSTDTLAALPSDYPFTAGDNGTHAFDVALKTAGTQSVTVTDTANGAITGTQTGIAVTPAPAVALIVAGYPTPKEAGPTRPFTVSAKDSYGNTATGYTGTVHFSSDDAAATLPADYTFLNSDNGTHTFAAALPTQGTHQITVRDTVTGSLTGSQTGIVAARARILGGQPAAPVAGPPPAAPTTSPKQSVR